MNSDKLFFIIINTTVIKFKGNMKHSKENKDQLGIHTIKFLLNYLKKN